MTLHFVYAGAPDNTLRYAPYTITRNLYRFFRSKGLDVRYYDLNETGPVTVGADDVVLGHPAADPGTVLQRMFRQTQRCRAKCTIHPLHHGIPEINLPFDALARQADLIFGIMGPYWYDTLEKSPFAHWKSKLVRVDMAVDAADFPFSKERFNPPGRRGLLYIGRESPEKGPHVLFETVRRLAGNPFLYLGWMQPNSTLLTLPNIVGARPVELTPEVVAQVTQAADIFINTSVSDANPTTLLEAAAWGLIPCCTRQSGYYGDGRNDWVFTELLLDDVAENVRRINALNWADERVLLERARRSRRVVEEKYNWERFCNTVWDGLRPLVEGGEPVVISSKAEERPAADADANPGAGDSPPAGPTVVIDGVFFQIINTGIARVWRSLLAQWSQGGFARQVVVIDRGGTAPKFPGLRYRPLPLFDFNRLSADEQMLQRVCDEEGASLFASTYYTLTLRTPSLFVAYDMIPEVLGQDLREPWWQLKHEAIRRASGFVCISENTARDLRRVFPAIPEDRVAVAYPGVDPVFGPRDEAAVEAFRRRYGVTRPYFLLVGVRAGYKGAGVFFEALSRLPNAQAYEVVCLGGPPALEPEFAQYAQRNRVQVLQVNDDEMAAAYAGAVALAYPSGYEGFGLPILEAMACGCPVITCPTGSIPEVAGEATVFVPYGDVDSLAKALHWVQRPEVRQSLVERGVDRAKRFSWAKMAAGVRAAMQQTVARVEAESEQDRAYAEQVFEAAKFDPAKTVALFSGPADERRRYDHYGEALAPLCRKFGLQVVAVGPGEAAGPMQRSLETCGASSAVNLCGRVTTNQAAEVLRRCRVAVGAEGELARIACNVGTPNVILVGGGYFGRFFPYSPLTTVVCLPLDCYGNGWYCQFPREFCVKDVQPAVLTAAIHDALERPRDGAPARPRLYVQDRSLWDMPGSLPPGQRPNWSWFHPMIDRLSLDMVTVGRSGGLPLPGGGSGVGGTQAECTLIRLPWRHRQPPQQSDAATDQLTTQRRQAAAAVLQTVLNDLPRVVSQVAQLLRASAVRETPARPEEMHLVDEIYSGIGRGPAAHGALQYRIAAMFYFRPHELPAGPAPQLIPDWMLEDYLRWTLEPPEMFYDDGEADAYGRYISDWVAALERLIVTDRESPLNKRYQGVVNLVAQSLNFIPLYFHGGDLVAPMRSRAAILRHAMRAAGQELDHSFPPRGERSKIRLGVIQNQYAPQTETYASIPLFKDLPRDRFEVILYALAQTNSPAEEQCRSLADRFVVLSSDLKAQVDAIRADDLDVLFFGTNLTAVTHPLVLLACFRLARLQATALHSPVTTGMETMDRFLLGLAGRDRKEAKPAYVEELAVVEEPGMAFDFTSRPAPSDFKIDRAALNITAGATAFVSGANFYKIIPEVRRAWARILAFVPGSYLVLYPFGPAWSNQYAAGGFLRNFYATLAEHGVEPRRVVILQPLPSPADIAKLLAICDVYLDSFPYAGAVSMIDALEAAIPPVAVAGGPQRFAQAAALLRSVGLDELIAADAESYVQLAVALARDPERRERLSGEIRRRMIEGPRFLDAKWYARQVAAVFERAVAK